MAGTWDALFLALPHVHLSSPTLPTHSTLHDYIASALCSLPLKFNPLLVKSSCYLPLSGWMCCKEELAILVSLLNSWSVIESGTIGLLGKFSLILLSALLFHTFFCLQMSGTVSQCQLVAFLLSLENTHICERHSTQPTTKTTNSMPLCAYPLPSSVTGWRWWSLRSASISDCHLSCCLPV